MLKKSEMWQRFKGLKFLPLGYLSVFLTFVCLFDCLFVCVCVYVCAVCVQPKPTFDEMSPELTALLKSAREQKTFREHNLLKVPV